MIICRTCFEMATRTKTLEAVKKLLRHGTYICPRLDRKCGNTAQYVPPDDSFAKVCDVIFNGRPA